MQENLLLDEKTSFVVVLPHIFLLGFFGIGLITIWKPLSAALTTHLRITNKRVEGKIGMIKTETMDSRLEQITSVKVEQGLLGKILNYGNININTASGNYLFKYMPNPDEIRKVINNAIDNVITSKSN